MKNLYLFLAYTCEYISLSGSIIGQISFKKNKTTKNRCRFILFLIVVAFSSQNLISQNIPGGAICDNASPLCYERGSSYIFENVTAGSAEYEIACLGTTPGPAWFFIKIDNSGTLEFKISQGQDNNNDGQIDLGKGLDVDFVV